MIDVLPVPGAPLIITPLLVGSLLVKWSLASRYNQSRPTNTGVFSLCGTSKKSGLRNHWTGMNWEVAGRSGVCLPICQEDLFASLEEECLLRTGAGMRVSWPEVREARLSELQKTGTPPSASTVDPLKVIIELS